MKDKDKSKRQLIEELVSLRQQVAELKTLEADRKRAEEALRESEATKQALLNAIPDMMFVIGGDGTYLDFIPSEKDEPLIPPDVFLGKKVREIMPAEIAEDHMRCIERALQTGEMQVVEYPLEMSGERRYYEARVVVSGQDSVLVLARDITARKRTGKALQESEQRYRLLIENIPTVAWVTSQDGRTIFISANVEKVYGYSPDEILAAGEELWFGRIHSEDKDRVKDAFEMLFSKQRPFDVEYRIQRKDGQWIWLQDRANLVEEKDGHLYAYGVFSDITERKQAEETLQESEEKYRTLTENSPNGIFISDTERFIYVNQRLCEIIGFSRDEFLNMPDPVDSLFASKERERVLAYASSRLSGSSPPTSYEAWGIRKDGEKVLLKLTVSSIILSGRRVLQGIVEDITERKRAEEALQESERKYRKLFEDSIDMISITTPEGQLVDVNQAGERLFGYSREELMVQNVQTIYASPEDRERFRQGLERDGTIRDFETQFRRADGTMIDVLLNAAVQWAEDGTVSGFQTIVHDITDRKQAEESLRESERRLSGFMNSASDSFYLLDSDLNFVEINQKGLDIIGKSREEVIGKNIADIVPDVKESGRYEKHLEVIRTGQPFEVEDFVPHPVFGDRHFILKSFKVGEGLGVIASDITDRKQAEEELRESEARYRFISENIADVIWTLSLKTGKFTYVSASVQNLRGYTPEEVMNQTMAEALTPESLQTATHLMQQRIARRKSGDTSPYKTISLLDQPCKDGSVVSTEVVTTMVFDEQGQPVEAIGITRDITERKQAEAALRESEERYRTLFESANDGILLMRQEQIIECNLATEKIFGRPRGELIGMTPIDLSPSHQPDGQDSEKKAWEKINGVLAGAPQRFEWVHSRLDGILFDAEISLNRVHLNGEWLILAFIRDVTRRKQAEEALQHYTDRLEILHEIDRAILAVESPEDIAQAALSHVRQLIPCQLAEVTLFDFTSNEAIVLAVDVDTETKVKAGSHVPLERLEEVIKSLRQGQVTTFGDLQSREKIFQTLYAEGVRSYTVVPLISQDELIGSLNLSYGTAEQRVFTQEYEAIVRQVADQLAIAIQQAHLHEQVQRHAEELEQRVAERTAELEQQYHRQAALEERQRLARDLHDSVTQTLFSMTLTAEATRILLERDPGRVPAQLDRLHELTQEALAEMRTLVRQLRSTTTDQGGLVPALRQHIAERQAQNDLQVTLTIAGEKQLPPEYEEALFRIVQEGLNNVVKHAQTQQATVTLHLTDEAVILVIEDDGVGFDPSTKLGIDSATSENAETSHFGLATMRERAKMLDGTFSLEARPGTGTRIEVEIPILLEAGSLKLPRVK